MTPASSMPFLSLQITRWTFHWSFTPRICIKNSQAIGDPVLEFFWHSKQFRVIKPRNWSTSCFLEKLQINVQNLPVDMDLNAAVEPPPPGVTSNFDNPESRAYETVIVFTIYLTIMMSIFLLRIYSKVFVTRSLGWDDCKSQDHWALTIIGRNCFSDSI